MGAVRYCHYPREVLVLSAYTGTKSLGLTLGSPILSLLLDYLLNLPLPQLLHI